MLLYDHRFYMFYDALKHEIHPEEMSFHFTPEPMDTEMNAIYTSVRRDDRNNNKTGGSNRLSQGVCGDADNDAFISIDMCYIAL